MFMEIMHRGPIGPECINCNVRLECVALPQLPVVSMNLLGLARLFPLEATESELS